MTALLGLAVLLLTTTALAADEICVPANDAVRAPYSVGCGGKSECQVIDQLEIKPLDTKAAPLEAVCVLPYQLNAPSEPLGVSIASMPLPQSYALSPLVHRWKNDATWKDLLPAAPDGRLHLQAVLRDKQRSYNAPFSIDLSSLWTAGTLALELPTVECNPCKIDGTIKLDVRNLLNWKRATTADISKLTLTVSGMKLTGIEPEVVASGVGATLIYRLRRIDSNLENISTWNSLIERALKGEALLAFQPAEEVC